MPLTDLFLLRSQVFVFVVMVNEGPIPGWASKYFQRISAVKTNFRISLLLKRINKNERLLTNPKLVFNEVLSADIDLVCVDLSFKMYLGHHQ